MSRLIGETKLGRTIAVGVVSALALVACGSLKEANAVDRKIRPCETGETVSYPGAKAPDSKPLSVSYARGELRERTQQNLKTLWNRAKLFDNQIDINDTDDITTRHNVGDPEVEANGANVAIVLDSQDYFSGAIDVYKTTFTRKDSDSDFEFSTGTLVCTKGQELFPTVVGQSISDYVEATKDLD